MGDGTGIEWTDATWNPIRGCSRVSEGCRHCYAETVAARFSGPGQPYEGLAHFVERRGIDRLLGAREARWTGKVKVIEEHVLDPLRWRRPRRIFVNSMSDLFHERVPDEWIDRIFAVMADADHHTYQVLTKRPERMRRYIAGLEAPGGLERLLAVSNEMTGNSVLLWPLPNVWLGVSVEDQAAADERIPLLLDTPAAVRFISAEPLLGPIDLESISWPGLNGHRVDVLRRGYWSRARAVFGPSAGPGTPKGEFTNHSDMPPGLDWVIAGGESGPGARPMHPDWARSLRDQCAAAGVPFFFKQWGEFHPSADHDHEAMGCLRTPEAINIAGDREYRPSEQFRLITSELGWAGMCRVGKKAAGRLLDGRTHDDMPGAK